MNAEELLLVEPTTNLKDAFLAMAAEFYAAGEYYTHHETAQHSFDVFVKRLDAQRKGEGLPAGYVPMHSFWLVKDGLEVLGESRLRHSLTPALRVEGGHIGYAIRPGARRKGYGTLILELTLEKARQRGLARVLLTCDTDNLASARIIEKNGGLLSGQAISLGSRKPVSQYWITL